jgi:hypothetical protein
MNINTPVKKVSIFSGDKHININQFGTNCQSHARFKF